MMEAWWSAGISTPRFLQLFKGNRTMKVLSSSFDIFVFDISDPWNSIICVLTCSSSEIPSHSDSVRSGWTSMASWWLDDKQNFSRGSKVASKCWRKRAWTLLGSFPSDFSLLSDSVARICPLCFLLPSICVVPDILSGDLAQFFTQFLPLRRCGPVRRSGRGAWLSVRHKRVFINQESSIRSIWEPWLGSGLALTYILVK